MTNRILIYHDDCADGLLAAYITREAFEEDDTPPVILHPAKYGSPPPDVRGALVLMVDFSYKRPVLERMLAECEGMILLDHHESAEKELAGLVDPKLTKLFDMTRSGAGLAWDVYHMGAKRPALVDIVEDADLWRWKVPWSKEISASFRALRFAYGMSACKIALDLMETKDGLSIMRAMGAHILQLRQQIIDSYVAEAKMVQLPGTHDDGTPLIAWATTCPPEYASDVGGALFEGSLVDEEGIPCAHSSFGITYFRDGDSYRVSLRSAYPRRGIHVGELARKFGGGGHPSAAGFQCKTLPWEMVE